MRKSALNCYLMARSFLLFHVCSNHSFSWWKVQTFLSAFKSKIDNAKFKLCERKNLFLRSINLRMLSLRGFLRLLINCYNSKRTNFSFITAYFFTSSVLTFFTSTYCTEQVVKIVLLSLKISFLLFFTQPIISEHANKCRNLLNTFY